MPSSWRAAVLGLDFFHDSLSELPVLFIELNLIDPWEVSPESRVVDLVLHYISEMVQLFGR